MIFNICRRLIKNGQLEIVTGGWVMTDEANAHWFSIVQQLTEGHVWLKTNFNATPKSGWAIDPFGESASMPIILKESGLENMLLQRTHYEVKKRLAKEKELEFRWRQTWGKLLRISYNEVIKCCLNACCFQILTVPLKCWRTWCHFTRTMCPTLVVPIRKCAVNSTLNDCLAMGWIVRGAYLQLKSLMWMWRESEWQIIVNVCKALILRYRYRAVEILDQWRKKSVLYRTRSVLIPLGDDFRYTQSTEWVAQRTNYEKLFDYMNNEPSLNVEAKFGTLQEYFDSVRSEKKLTDFPSLSGDFFTYSDREDHYWSGYFTSRPFHKRLDRILLTYLR